MKVNEAAVNVNRKHSIQKAINSHTSRAHTLTRSTINGRTGCLYQEKVLPRKAANFCSLHSPPSSSAGRKFHLCFSVSAAVLGNFLYVFLPLLSFALPFFTWHNTRATLHLQSTVDKKTQGCVCSWEDFPHCQWRPMGDGCEKQRAGCLQIAEAHKSLNYLQKLHTRTTALRYYFIDFSLFAFLSDNLSPIHLLLAASDEVFSFYKITWKFQKKMKREQKKKERKKNRKSHCYDATTTQRRTLFVATMKIFFFPEKKKHTTQRKICDYITVSRQSLCGCSALNCSLYISEQRQGCGGEGKGSWSVHEIFRN